MRLVAAPVSGWAAPAKQQIHVTGYVINADLYPARAKLTATAAVTFTALEDLTSVTFELNNGLLITKLTDAKNNAAAVGAADDQLDGADYAADAAAEGHLDDLQL